MHAQPYTSAAEHLSDELRLLDHLAARLIEADTNDGGTLSSEARMLGLGPYVTPADARRLVSDPARNSAEPPAPLAAKRSGRSVRERIEASVGNIFLPVEWLRAVFDLGDFSWKIVLACVAPYLDERYRRLYAYLHNDVSRTSASIGLLQRLLCESFEERLALRRVLENHSAFRDWGLVRFDPTTDALTVDPGPINLLAGNSEPPAEFAHCLDFPHTSAENADDADENLTSTIAARLSGVLSGLQDSGDLDAPAVVLSLCGRRGSGRYAAARQAARELNRPLFRLRLRDLARTPKRTFEESYLIVLRECRMHHAVLFIEDFGEAFPEERPRSGEEGERGDAGPNEFAQRQVRRDFLLRESVRRGAFVMLACERAPSFSALTGEDAAGGRFPVVEFALPDYAGRRALWRSALQNAGIAPTVMRPEDLAGMYRFTPGEISAAVRAAGDRARSSGGVVMADDLISGCRAQCSRRLEELARPIRTVHHWQDLILPEEHLAQLRDMHVYFKQRDLVFDEWAFGSRVGGGRGYHALFAGPPGTGKTMAAGIIAAELRLEAYRIDLASMISKYIGETEKNLSAIFREAEASQAILFFDEADAIFGKRSEVKDAHDRYANIETSYLLQRMEEYDGITILATNLLQNIDEAFLRRLHVVVDFPFPDEEHRRRIWEGIFPAQTPLADDVDPAFLAERARIAGGNIKNIALAAAVAAAEEGSSVQMRHIMQAARAEYRKIGKPFVEREFVK